MKSIQKLIVKKFLSIQKLILSIQKLIVREFETSQNTSFCYMFERFCFCLITLLITFILIITRTLVFYDKIKSISKASFFDRKVRKGKTKQIEKCKQGGGGVFALKQHFFCFITLYKNLSLLVFFFLQKLLITLYFGFHIISCFQKYLIEISDSFLIRYFWRR